MFHKTQPLFAKLVKLSVNDSWQVVEHITSSNTCIYTTNKIINERIKDYLKKNYSTDEEEQLCKEIGKLTLFKEWQKHSRGC